MADPKLAICQARVKRSASAPNHPRGRAYTDQLPRKGSRQKEDRNMHKGNSTSSEDVRAVGRWSLLGVDQGVDGIFVRRKDEIVERVITDFPVDNNSSSSRTDKITRPENYKRDSWPDNGGKRSSQESLPKNCVNCGQPIDFSRDLDHNSSAETTQASKYLKCKKCGHIRNYSSGGSSLPGTPYSAHRTLETSPFGLPSQRTAQSSHKVNGNLNHKPAQMHGNSGYHLSKNNEPSKESSSVLNGTLKTDFFLPPDSAGKQFNDLLYETPSALAQRLFNLEGFDREEVSPELSKK